MRFHGQVRVVDQQQRRGAQLTIVMVDARTELAAQPGTKKAPLHLRPELALPALLQSGQQGHQQLLAQGSRRIQRHRLIDAVIQGAFLQSADCLQQRLQQGVPIVVDELAEGLRRVEQWLDLADGNATVEPGEDGLDALYVVGREQPMALGRA
ncbi:hypothetical protein D3C81_1274870 [compost metagenome]